MESLTNYLKSCVAEMVLGAVAMGKESLSAVDRNDLCALTPEVAELTGVQLAYRRKTYDFPQPAEVRKNSENRAYQ
ncbi:MAG TPA: hypothetical protein DDZ91_07285 [Firmicutes bacterium]|nr:hypothetical protein [Bacillota bacterium]